MLLNISISANLAMSQNCRWENCLLQFHWYHSRKWTSATTLHPAHQNTHTFKCQTSHLQRCPTIPKNWMMVQLIISFFWQQMPLV